MEEIENCQRQRKKHGRKITNFQKGTEIGRQDRKFMKEDAKGDIRRKGKGLPYLGVIGKLDLVFFNTIDLCPFLYYERCAFHNA